MSLFWVLLLSFGTLAFCSDCVPETARCSQFLVKIWPHKELISTERELDAWCSKQHVFYECLESILLEGKNGNLSYLPTNLLISKLFAQDLCTDGSKNRQRLLSNADCINQLNTDYCALPEYLDIVTPDESIPSSRCSQSEKTFSCIAATMVLNCGFDAGRVYRALLKITRYSDEVCGIERSEGIPPCEESGLKSAERDKKLSEIYYGLFHRIGDVLEQDDLKELGESSSEHDRSVEVNVDEAVTEVIKSAIDNLDNKIWISDKKPNSPSVPRLRPLEKLIEYKHYMKNPLIAEVFRGILFYNYSGLEYAAYWRQPEFTVMDNIQCEHLQPSYLRGVIFRCKFEYRYEDPDCVANTTVHEKVTPELIRELDPEVPYDSTAEYGPRPDWMKVIDEAYEEKRVRDQFKSTTASSTFTNAPEVYTTTSSLLHIATTMCTEKKPKNWWELQHNINSFIPNDVHYELIDLFFPEPEKYVPPPMNTIKIGDTLFFLIYDPLLTNSVENITCSRLDECYARAKGIWKCRWWRRKIETCDVCYGGTGASILGLPVTYASPAKQVAESQFKVHETTEPTLIDNGSGTLADEAPTMESIALVFSDGSKTEIPDTSSEDAFGSEAEKYSSEIISEEDYLEEKELDEYVERELEYNLAHGEDIKNNVRLEILTSMLDSDGPDSTHKMLYEIYDADSEEKESDVIVATDELGLLPEQILWLEDISEDAVKDQYSFVTPSMNN